MALAMVLGYAAVLAVWMLKRDVIEAVSEIWEAGFEFIAVVLQTYLAVKFLSFSGTSFVTAKWERKVNQHIHLDSTSPSSTPSMKTYTFALLAFTAVLREGLECVVYLTGVNGGDHPLSLVLPGLLGVSGSLLTGILIYRFSARLELKSLMLASSILMLVLSATLASDVASK
ncbi:high-affinity iron permease, partial [Dinochytrium kinnereticum]